ncbi:hypothetical protein AKJ49_01460 [candidate division MSBL1 archaeon SCGC-AAA382A03]|uniref:Restriction endonuclease n=1 Tax=candidate division MSBL1 archaeon SCGC-AAA382A03 TaxID=1698278 RepID=A0A133VF69_9EURY|nr:hypothetical protein AKJ49_01460 [candidate division MSBL1 archaeon SCGC-AAA382A03]
MEDKNLFDDIERDLERPRLDNEPCFEYLNISARIESQKIRELLEQWFKRYPSEHQDDLRGRFRDKDDRIHIGAFFELYLHELMIRSGYEVEVHPDINGTTNHPDFEVLTDELEFYLEATSVM